LHVRILHQRVEEIGGLDETEAAVSQGSDGGIHADADSGNGHVHEVGLLLLALVILSVS